MRFLIVVNFLLFLVKYSQGWFHRELPDDGSPVRLDQEPDGQPAEPGESFCGRVHSCT